MVPPMVFFSILLSEIWIALLILRIDNQGVELGEHARLELAVRIVFL
jgi:hypothetical protein